MQYSDVMIIDLKASPIFHASTFARTQGSSFLIMIPLGPKNADVMKEACTIDTSVFKIFVQAYVNDCSSPLFK